MSSLSPVHTIGSQIIETIQLHRNIGKADARAAAIEVLRRVQIPDSQTAIDKYSFEFSGGMHLRAMIAMALFCDPEILIADEPTMALDVTTQAEILRLIKQLQHELSMSVVFITHGMGVVAEIADRIAVMCHGELIEISTVEQVFQKPPVDYTRHLIGASSIFTINGDHNIGGIPRLTDPDSVLEVENLNLTFRKSTGILFRKVQEFHALEDVSLTLQQGENLGNVGESGSGKTTLVRALVGLIPADSGSARYQSKDGRVFDLQPDLDLSYLFVGHDLGVVRYFCDRIAVMHQGSLVEIGDASNVCQRPEREYTKRLIAAVPAGPIPRIVVS